MSHETPILEFAQMSDSGAAGASRRRNRGVELAELSSRWFAEIHYHWLDSLALGLVVSEGISWRECSWSG
jgi:hypothetical protein